MKLLATLVLSISVITLAHAEQLVLVGDAGDTTATFMARVVEESAKDLQSTVIFLGDNIYPAGLPDQEHPEYKAAQKRLLLQAKPFIDQTAKVFFVAGNHDWDNTGEHGLERLQNQEWLLGRTLGFGTLRPKAGCPGPEVLVNTKNFFVLAIDSMWFLHPHKKLTGAQCEAGSVAEFEQRLATLLRTKQSTAQSVLVFHHPFVSHGKHGIGDKCPNGNGCAVYQEFIATVGRGIAASGSTVDICAAGHEHTIEIIPGVAGCKMQIVSGAGSYPRPVEGELEHGFGVGNVFGFVVASRSETQPKTQLRVVQIEPTQPVIEKSLEQWLAK